MVEMMDETMVVIMDVMMSVIMDVMMYVVMGVVGHDDGCDNGHGVCVMVMGVIMVMMMGMW